MDLGWKVLIPIALGWFLLLAAIRVGRDSDWDTWVVLAVTLAVLAVSYVLMLARRAGQPAQPRTGRGDVLMGYLEGFGVTARQHRLFGGKRVTANYSGGRAARRRAKGDELPPPDAEDDVKAPKPARLHGRHVLGRYEDGMEKCIGCELCAGVCPAKCIYVRGADNDPDNPTSPGERFGFVYEINYLRCIHCDLCVEACPTEAITESKLFEFSFTNRKGRDLHQDRAGRRRRRTAAPPPVGGLAQGRGRRHQRVGAGDGTQRRRRLHRPGRAGAPSSATDCVRPSQLRTPPTERTRNPHPNPVFQHRKEMGVRRRTPGAPGRTDGSRRLRHRLVDGARRRHRRGGAPAPGALPR